MDICYLTILSCVLPAAFIIYMNYYYYYCPTIIYFFALIFTTYIPTTLLNLENVCQSFFFSYMGPHHLLLCWQICLFKVITTPFYLDKADQPWSLQLSLSYPNPLYTPTLKKIRFRILQTLDLMKNWIWKTLSFLHLSSPSFIYSLNQNSYDYKIISKELISQDFLRNFSKVTPIQKIVIVN